MEAKDIVAKEVARQAAFGYEPSWEDFVIAGQQVGIREVVKWILKHSQLEQCDPDVMPYFIDYLAVDYPDWQAKLKEWGL